MDTIKLIRNHRSVRRYKTDPIPDDLLEEVLETGIRASSYGNMQTYSVVVSRQQETRDRLYLVLRQQEMVRQAPLQLTFCVDFRRMRKWLAANNAPDNFGDFLAFLIGTVDACLVAQNVALAAEDRGLGICFIGATLVNADQVGEVLELPEGVVPVTGMAMGWPDEDPPLRDRLPLSGLVHYDRYHDHDDAEIAEIFAERNTAGWDRYMSSPGLRKAITDAELVNLAQVYTSLKYTPETHKTRSAALLDYLRRQGFLG